MLRRCSLFAFPLFQNEGYVTMLCQFAGAIAQLSQLAPARAHIQHDDSGDAFVMVPLQAVKDLGEGAKPWLMVRGTAQHAAPLPTLAGYHQRPVLCCR